MTDEHTVDRRTVLKGAIALGASTSVAGCSSLPIAGGDGGDGGGGGLSYGTEIEGELTEDDDEGPHRGVVADSYEFSGSSGDEVQITMNSDPLDPFLVLEGPSGDVVDSNDDNHDAGAQFDSRITTTLPTDGTYTIWASRFDPAGVTGEATGTYTLTLEEV